jgi:indolepyruvate ferredoxin oxidoreductase, alpha subunit
MSPQQQKLDQQRLFMSGNEAVALGMWQAGCRVAAAYPGTPATEILEYAAQYEDMYSEWSVNEKVSMEVAIGASLAGSRAFCAMKHVGLNVASDALMSQTLAGVNGGLVIAVADDVGLSSSQNEQDSRFWGRFAHVPILEPCDSQEAYEMCTTAFEISEQFDTPVILRLTTRICHVKGVVVASGERWQRSEEKSFESNSSKYVMTPANARGRIPLMFERDEKLSNHSETTALNYMLEGSDRRIGFITSGPTFLHVQEAFPDAPVFKLGMSYPPPMDKLREFSAGVEKLIVVEEVEPLLETEMKAAGIDVIGKQLLPKFGELSPQVLLPAINPLLGRADIKAQPETKSVAVTLDISKKGAELFPRPPTMCVACPHLGIYYTLSHIRNKIISGDIGCYTLGAGHPWNSLDTCICMGASMGVAHGLDKGRNEADANKSIIAVIGDSTFMHMGMQGLLDIAYNGGNVTVLLLDNRAVGMTGGQENPGTGHDIHGNETPRVDFRKLTEAIGIKPERIHEVNPYELPTLFKALRSETKINEASVIITNQPCVLVDYYATKAPYEVIEDTCTGCTNCLDLGCPAISVTRRETVMKPNGKEKELAFVRIDSQACTGCELCLKTCGPNAIQPVADFSRGQL